LKDYSPCWRQLKWGDLATLEYGKGLRGYQAAKSRYPVYGTNGLIGWHDTALCKKPGIIIGRKGAYRGVHLSKTPFFVIDTAFYLNLLSNEVDLTWAYYQLINFDINKIDSGSAIPSTSREAFYQIPVLLPPLLTQRKIAAILSAYDDLTENNMRRIAILEEMARSLYREWFVHFRFPGHEKIRMVESEMGLIPEGWEVNTLENLGTIVTGKTPSKLVFEYFNEAYMPFVKTPDLHGNIFCIQTEEYLSEQGALSQKNKTIPPNSLCVNCIGAKSGAVSITTFQCQTNQQINSMILEEKYLREFLFFALVGLKETIHQYGSNGATMVNLNKGKFGALRTIYPEQSILMRFHELTYPMFEEIKALQLKNLNLRQTRDLLLPKLISGEVDVEGLDIRVEGGEG